LADPVYRIRAAFRPTGWEDIAVNSYTWAHLAEHYTWEQLATTGEVPDGDISQINIRRDLATMFDPLQAGEAVVILDNTSGDYCPHASATNAVKLASSIFIKALTDAGSLYSMFHGYAEHANAGAELGQQNVAVTYNDPARYLERRINTVFQVDTKTSSLVTEVLSAVNMHHGNATIALATDDTLPYAYLDDISGGEAYNRILQSGHHYMYIDGRGELVFRDRNFDVGQTAVSSYSDAYLGMSSNFNLHDVINDVRIGGTNRKVTTSQQTVAWLESKPSVTASSYIDLFVSYTDTLQKEQGTPVQSLGTPVNSSDYTANTAEDGSGTDKTATFSANVLGAFATTAKVRLYNGSDVSVYVTKFQLHGYPLELKPATKSLSEVSSSQDEYDRRSLAITNDLINGTTFAQTLGDFIVSRRKDPSPRATVTIKNEFPEVLARELLDRVTVNDTATRINDPFVIHGLEHQIGFTRGLEHTLSMEMFTADTKNYLILDKDPEGKLDTDRVYGV